jgi:hypothetical protein
MSCCGGLRAKAANPLGQATQGGTSGPSPVAQPTARDVAYFQYVGSTALTVFGSVSGTRYRFTAPGVTLAVDSRDRASVAEVPHLRQVPRR